MGQSCPLFDNQSPEDRKVRTHCDNSTEQPLVEELQELSPFLEGKPWRS